MKRRQIQVKSRAQQSGAALVVALIILAVVTVLGVANMGATTMEMKMATSSLKRAEQFAFAEKAMAHVEDHIGDKVRNKEDLFTDTCASPESTDPTLCFNKDCTNGYCFVGEYDSSMLAPTECEIETNSRSVLWKTENRWSSAPHGTLAVPFTATQDRTVKFLAEFLCFVDNGETGTFGRNHDDENGVPVFRITVLVENDEDGDNRVPIMLQSNYVRIINVSS